jgi:DNA uptake protein ComE-like DNA-binding protein
VQRIVDINTAPQSELIILRGIGLGRAAQIIAARPFKSAHDLVHHGIISERMYAQIAEQLEAGEDQRGITTAS